MPANLENPFGESCCDGGICSINVESAQSCGCDKGVNWTCLRHKKEAISAALQLLLDRYVSLVNCGDCGNWDPETEEEVISARKALLL